jgi:hypothetical protein
MSRLVDNDVVTSVAVQGTKISLLKFSTSTYNEREGAELDEGIVEVFWASIVSWLSETVKSMVPVLLCLPALVLV